MLWREWEQPAQNQIILSQAVKQRYSLISVGTASHYADSIARMSEWETKRNEDIVITRVMNQRKNTAAL